LIVRKLTFEGFRNLHPGTWEPDEGVNILYGDNAQGKTNLLEACWLFTGSRSFRGARDREMVGFTADKASLTMDFYAAGREQSATITIDNRRQVTLNGVRLPSAARLAGTFCGVVFSPAHLSLIKEGPEGRRRFIDAAYCQLRPGYVGTLAEYHKVLAQRNATLRQAADGGFTSQTEELLSLWDTTLAAAGARLTAARQHYIGRLEPLAREIYHRLSGGRESLSLQLQSPAAQPAYSPADMARCWLTALQGARLADRGAGFTTVGPHREDVEILLDGTPARVYGSQGQQRSAVLALKLAEASLLQEVTGEPPVAFLDDVMSELDVSRQDYILNHIHRWQVFITCCEPSSALRMTGGKVFAIKEGKLG